MWQQHPTRHQLYGHLPPITKTIQVRRTRHAGHCWRSRDELIRDVLLWIPTHGRAKAGRPARTYIQQLCEDTGCCPEDLPRAMNDREEWRERVRDIRAASTIWWWWYTGQLEFTPFILSRGCVLDRVPNYRVTAPAWCLKRRDLSIRLIADSDWILWVENFRHYIFIWRPYIFLSVIIHVTFSLSLVYLKTQLHILFTKSKLTDR